MKKEVEVRNHSKYSSEDWLNLGFQLGSLY